jgi:hypothetical protein
VTWGELRERDQRIAVLEAELGRSWAGAWLIWSRPGYRSARWSKRASKWRSWGRFATNRQDKSPPWPLR